MKSKFVRDDQECTAREPDEEQTIIKQLKRNGKMVKRRFWKLNGIVDHPKAYRLVQMGVAVPADAECEEAANMTAEEMNAAQHGAERLARGIRPEDYKLFDRGVILGYNPDGSYIPGPNGHELEELEEEDEDGISEED